MSHEDTELYDLAAKAGAELGMTAQAPVHEHQRSVNITAPDGRGYSIMREWGNPAKLVITPVYPDTEMTLRGQRGSIGVTAARGPQVVAREITRRLEPAYTAKLAEVVAYNADRDADDQSRETVKAALTAAADAPGCSVSWPSHMQGRGSAEAVIYGPGTTGGDVKMYGAATEVQFDRFRVPAEVAAVMLEAYAAWAGDQ